MKKVFIILLVLMTAPHLFSQNKWEFVTKVNSSLSSVTVVDTNTIFLISSQVAYNYLQKTNNQWKSWDLLKKGEDFDVYSYNTESIDYLSTPDELNVYVSFNHPRGYIYHSSDGGLNFNVKSIFPDAVIYIINMLTNKIGVAGVGYGKTLAITKDNWETMNYYDLPGEYRFSYPGRSVSRQFINDTIIGAIVLDRVPSYLTNPNFEYYFLRLNINTLENEIHTIDRLEKGMLGIYFIKVINENTYYLVGKGYGISGGSGHDMIYKTTDGGRNWRCVLDMYGDDRKFGLKRGDLPPFGLQSIDFKDSLNGIATGQFGKIVYTYDGGETWIYENNIPDIISLQPAVFYVNYAGTTPYVYGFSGQIFKLTEDNLAPKQSDTITICGRVTHNGAGIPLVPVAIGLRLTMTDSLGYYKFTRLPAGKHIVKVLNKYLDLDVKKFLDSYRPYIFSPDSIELALTDDSCGVNFTATQNLKYYTLSGKILDTLDHQPVQGIKVKLNELESITDENGIFTFPDLESHIFYVFEPISEEYLFHPPKRSNRLLQDTFNVFTAYKPMYSISGTIYDSTSKQPLSGITVNMGAIAATSDEQGKYIFSPIMSGDSYSLVPTSAHYIFHPSQRTFTLQKDTTGLDFAGELQTGVKDIITMIMRQDGNNLIIDDAYIIDHTVIISDIRGSRVQQTSSQRIISLAHLARGSYIISLATEQQVIATMNVVVE